jgi:hypothetical protein
MASNAASMAVTVRDEVDVGGGDLPMFSADGDLPMFGGEVGSEGEVRGGDDSMMECDGAEGYYDTYTGEEEGKKGTGDTSAIIVTYRILFRDTSCQM